MLSNASRRNDDDGTDTITIDGRTYRSINTTYRILNADVMQSGALVDGGSNGGLCGADCRILEKSIAQTVDVSGISPDVMYNLPLVQCASKVETQDEGTIILIMSQYAQRPEGKTIHSKTQLEDFGCIVYDTPRSRGGNQVLITPEGHVVPLHIRDGLHFIDMTPPTDDEMEMYPHVFITSDAPWDPSVLNDEFHSTEPIPNDPIIQERRDARNSLITQDGNISFPRLMNSHKYRSMAISNA